MKESDQDKNQPQEISLPIEEAAIWLMKNVIPFTIFSLVPFFIIYGFSGFRDVAFFNILWFFVCILFGVILHELIHAFVFGLFSKGGFRSISFGIEPKTNSPWCHCKSEMSVLIYRVGALAPFFIMGLFPLIYAYFIASPGWLFFGSFYSLGGGGDWISVFLTRDLKTSDVIMDHPSKLGFYIISRK